VSEVVALTGGRNQGRFGGPTHARRLVVLLTYVPRGSSLDLFAVLGVIVLFATGLALAQIRRH
jgi:hypothetical protein